MTGPGAPPRLKGRVWITRAQPGAARTAARLSALGFDPVVAPLLKIRALPQPAPDLTDVAALVFTSRNAVSAFASLTAARDRSVLTVGDATAEAARAAGFADVRSASGDLKALAQLIAADLPPFVHGNVLLHPAAREPAGDLAALLGPSTPVRTLPIYEADRHAKKELKKRVRGVRPVERAAEGRDDPEAEAVRGYCAAVRSAITDDGRPPLAASGLKLADRLEAVVASPDRVAEKGG